METDPNDPQRPPPSASAAPSIAGVLETIVYAEDLSAARAFYEGVLGLPVVSGDGTLAFAFRIAEGSVLLVFDPRESLPEGRVVPSHGMSGPGHVALRIDPDRYDDWRAHLGRRGVEIEHEQAWPIRPPAPGERPAHNEGRSIYVRDPAGNSVELITADIWPGVG